MPLTGPHTGGSPAPGKAPRGRRGTHCVRAEGTVGAPAGREGELRTEPHRSAAWFSHLRISLSPERPARLTQPETEKSTKTPAGQRPAAVLTTLAALSPREFEIGGNRLPRRTRGSVLRSPSAATNNLRMRAGGAGAAQARDYSAETARPRAPERARPALTAAAKRSRQPEEWLLIGHRFRTRFSHGSENQGLRCSCSQCPMVPGRDHERISVESVREALGVNTAEKACSRWNSAHPRLQRRLCGVRGRTAPVVAVAATALALAL